MKKLLLALLIFVSYFLVTNAQMKEEFALTAIGTNSSSTSKSEVMRIDSNNNLIVAGTFSDTLDFDPSLDVLNLYGNGSTNIFFAKYDENGKILWAKNIGGLGYDGTYSLTLDADDNIYLTGMFFRTIDLDPSDSEMKYTVFGDSTEIGNCDNFIAKYDKNGNFIWGKQIGGPLNDNINSIVLDEKKNIYITGTFFGTADFDPSISTASIVSGGNKDIYIAKYDSLGNYIWAKSITGTTDKAAYNIKLDSNKNIFIVGSFSGAADFDPSSNTATLTPLQSDIFLAKYDSLGNYIWAKKMGGSLSEGAEGLAILNNEVYVAGYIRDKNISSDFNIYLAKYSNAGTSLWSKIIGGNSFDNCPDIFINKNNKILITGYFSGVVDFDPSSNVYNLTAQNIDNDLYFAKYDLDGNFIQVNKFTGTASTKYANCIVEDNNENIYMSGYASDGTLDLGVINPIVFQSTNTFMFVAKYSNITTDYTIPNKSNNNISINVLDNQIYFTGLEMPSNVQIFNTNGMKIKSTNHVLVNQTITIGDKGLYIVTVQNDKQHLETKVLVK